MTKTLSVLVPITRHVLFVAKVWISLLSEGCRLYTIALVHDGIRIDFYSRRNAWILLRVIILLGLIHHLLVKRLRRNLILILVVHMLLIVVIIRSLSLSWPHMILSSGKWRVLKHRVTFIPKVLDFLRYGTLYWMMLVFTWNVLGIFDVDFGLTLYVGHLPVDPLFLVWSWQLMLVLLWLFLCR